ncbi:MAG: GNAT family N-acetyltransferase [Spirochaetales bacterium]|nr:GNAT family N-acetyltransferase [Spirochaetales bacterium]
MMENKTDDFIVRKLMEEDVPLAARFEREIAEISFGAEAITDLAFHEKKIEKDRNQGSGGMLILEYEGKVAGFLWMAAKSNYITNETYINFKTFYIVEEFRGTNGARVLLEEGMEFCRNKKAKRIIGKVHAGNLSMRVLYKQFGFKPTHITMEYSL